MDLGATVFYVVAAVTLLASLGVVVSRSVVYSALLLILSLLMTGLVYLLLLSDFLFLVQILVYGGTVSILLLFALMLTRPQERASLTHRGWPVAAIGAVVLLAILVFQGVTTAWAPAAGNATAAAGSARGITAASGASGAASRTGSSTSAGLTTTAALSPAPVRVGPAELGTALFTTWAVPFEISSLVLLVALVGALVIARSADAPGGA